LIQAPVAASMLLKQSMRKRDAEQEADSANGKSPIQILFKKPSFSTGGGADESHVFGNGILTR
jgi:hypothetical protein